MDELEGLEDPLDNFLVVCWGDDGHPEIDLGAINHYEAQGLLKACLLELESRNPSVRVRFSNGLLVDSDEEED